MEVTAIKNSIHEIRGKKVILDVDLAKMYQVETKNLKRTVRNHSKRFPPDFMFELTPDEWKDLRCINSTSSWGGQRYAPFAFTEQGIAMLSGLLNSQIAIDVNISIMRAFVLMREWALTYQELAERIASLEKQHGKRFDDIEQVLNYLIKKEKQSMQQQERKQVGYKK